MELLNINFIVEALPFWGNNVSSKKFKLPYNNVGSNLKTPYAIVCIDGKCRRVYASATKSTYFYFVYVNKHKFKLPLSNWHFTTTPLREILKNEQ